MSRDPHQHLDPAAACPWSDDVVAHFLDGDTCAALDDPRATLAEGSVGASPAGQGASSALARHLRGCAVCNRHLEDARRIDALVAADAAIPTDPRFDTWLARAREQGAPVANSSSAVVAAEVHRGLPRWVLPVGIAAALCVGTGIGLLLAGGERRTRPLGPPPAPGERVIDAAPQPSPRMQASRETEAPIDLREGVLIAEHTTTEQRAPEQRSPEQRGSAPARRFGTSRLAADLEDPLTRSQAIVRLCQEPDGRLATTLGRILERDSLVEEAWLAASALHAGDPMSVLSVPARALELERSWIAGGLQALGRMPGRRATQVLLGRYLAGANALLESAYLEILRERRRDLPALLRPILDSGSERQLHAAFLAVAALELAELQPELERLCLRGKPETNQERRDALARALRQHPTEMLFTTLFRVVRQEETVPTAYEVGLQRFRGQDPRFAAWTLDRAQRTRNAAERVHALRVLGQLGADQALPLLRASCGSPHHEERIAALLALRDLGSEAAARELWRQTEEGRQPELAFAALLTSPIPAIAEAALNRLALVRSELIVRATAPLTTASDLNLRGNLLARFVRRLP